jgi:hypothetical protein
MIIVNMPRSWPQVLQGHRSPESATLFAWQIQDDAQLERYATQGSIILGVYRNSVVSAFEIHSYDRNFLSHGRVQFHGIPTVHEWLGSNLQTVAPNLAWQRGQVYPVQFVEDIL